MPEHKNYGLSEYELDLMKFIWDSEHPLSFAELMNYCNKKKNYNWAKTTLHTYLTRLIQKGVLSCDKSLHKHLYAPKLTEQELSHLYAEQFVREAYNGSIKDLLLSFTYNTPLSKEEIAELQTILDNNLS